MYLKIYIYLFTFSVMMEKRLIVTEPPRLAHVQMAAPHWSDPLVPMELMYNAQV